MLKFKDENGETVLLARFDEIKDILELISQPPVVVYLIRDRETGKYYKNNLNSYDNYWCNTPGSAKQMKTLAQAKQRCLYMIGYYNDMGENAPAMLYNHNPLNMRYISPSWEIVSYEKVSKTYTTVMSVSDYINKIIKLKTLTTKYGSAVRELYTTLEKKEILGKYGIFLVFHTGDTILQHDNSLVETSEDSIGGSILKIKDSELEEIKKLFKGSRPKSIKNDSCAIAFENKNELSQLRLSYNGNLLTLLVDVNTLNESII